MQLIIIQHNLRFDLPPLVLLLAKCAW